MTAARSGRGAVQVASSPTTSTTSAPASARSPPATPRPAPCSPPTSDADAGGRRARRARSRSSSPARAASDRACSPTCSSPSRRCAGTCASATASGWRRCTRRPRSATAARPSARLTDTRVAQPALGIADLAMRDLLGDLRRPPRHHRRAQLRRAGRARRRRRLRPEDLLGAQRARAARRILAAAGDDPGTMAAVRRRGRRRCSAVIERWPAVVVANHNAPDQVVISGPTDACSPRSRRSAPPGTAPSGSPSPAPSTPRRGRRHATTLAERLADVDGRAAGHPGLRQRHGGGRYPDDPDAIRAELAGTGRRAGALRRARSRPCTPPAPGCSSRSARAGCSPSSSARSSATVRTGRSPPTRPGEPGLRRFLLALAELAASGSRRRHRPAVRRTRPSRSSTPPSVPRTAPFRFRGSLVCDQHRRPGPGHAAPGRRDAPLRLDRRGRRAAPDGDPSGAVAEYLRGPARDRRRRARRDAHLPRRRRRAPPPGGRAASGHGGGDAGDLRRRASPSPAGAPPRRRPDAPRSTARRCWRRWWRSCRIARAIRRRCWTRTWIWRPSCRSTRSSGSRSSVSWPSGWGCRAMTDGAVDESVVEELALVKTLRGIVDWIAERGRRPPRRAARSPATATTVAAATGDHGPRPRGAAGDGGGDRVGSHGLSGRDAGPGPGSGGRAVDRLDQADRDHRRAGRAGGAAGDDRRRGRRVGGRGAGAGEDAARHRRLDRGQRRRRPASDAHGRSHRAVRIAGAEPVPAARSTADARGARRFAALPAAARAREARPDPAALAGRRCSSSTTASASSTTSAIAWPSTAPRWRCSPAPSRPAARRQGPGRPVDAGGHRQVGRHPRLRAAAGRHDRRRRRCARPSARSEAPSASGLPGLAAVRPVSAPGSRPASPRCRPRRRRARHGAHRRPGGPGLWARNLDVDPAIGAEADRRPGRRPSWPTGADLSDIGFAGGERVALQWHRRRAPTRPTVRRRSPSTATAWSSSPAAPAASAAGSPWPSPDVPGAPIELVGRTPLPAEPEPDHLAGGDRRRRAAQGPHRRRRARGDRPRSRPPRQQVLARREIDATMAALEGAASSVRYHAVDVRDAGEPSTSCSTTSGSATAASTASSTPPASARTSCIRDKDADVVRAGLRHEGRRPSRRCRRPRPPTASPSCSAASPGVFGNTGQVDYAAANDVLDGTARRHAGRRAPGDLARLGPVGRHRHGHPRAGPHLRGPRRRPHRRRRRRRPRARRAGPRPARPTVVLMRATPERARPRHASDDQRVTRHRDRRPRPGGDRRHGRGVPRRARPRPRSGATSSAASTPSARCPPDRIDPVFFGPEQGPDRFYCRRGGFVDAVRFDAGAFGIMPVAAAEAEPDQLVALAIAAQALDDAGWAAATVDPGRVGIVLGRGGYLNRGVARLDQRVRTAHQLVTSLRELLPELDDARLAEVKAAFQAGLGPNRPEAVDRAGAQPGRVPRRQPPRPARPGLHRRRRLRELAARRRPGRRRAGAPAACDLMLAGGVHHCHDVTLWSVFSQLGALSPSGDDPPVRPAAPTASSSARAPAWSSSSGSPTPSATATGSTPSIRGTGVASDGRAARLMSPRPRRPGPRRRAGLDEAPASTRRTVGLIEAHGTATPAGDAAELATLRRVFGADGDGAPRGRPRLGEVDDRPRHAGRRASPGSIKAALAVHHGVLPPTLHCDEPHPGLAGTRFRPIDRGRAVGVARRPSPGRRQRVRVRRHQRARRAGGPRRRHRTRRRPRVARAAGRPDVDRAAPAPSRAGRDPAVPRRRRRRRRHHRRAGRRRRRPRRHRPAALRRRRPGPHRHRRPDPQAPRRRPQDGRPGPGVAGPQRHLVHRRRPGERRAARSRTPSPGSRSTSASTWTASSTTSASTYPRLVDVEGTTRMGADMIWLGRVLDTALRDLGITPDHTVGHSLGEWTAMIVSGAVPASAVDEFIGGLADASINLPDLVFLAVGAGADVAGVRRRRTWSTRRSPTTTARTRRSSAGPSPRWRSPRSGSSSGRC